MTRAGKSRRAVWYKNGLRFRCKKCGACCRGEPGYVWVTNAEIEAMAGYLGMSAAAFVRKYVRLVGIRKSLRERKSGDCVLYDNGCIVYEARPRQCAAWPFWKCNIACEEEWREIVKTCPGAGRGRLYSAGEIENFSES